MTRQITQQLTPAEEAFCQSFVRTRSFARAIDEAYKPTGDVSAGKMYRTGYALYRKTRIRERVDALLDQTTVNTMFTAAEAIGTALAIFNADPNELVSIKVGCCRYCHGDGHEYQWREHEYLIALQKAEKVAVELPNIGGGFGFDHTLDPHDDCPVCRGEGEPREVVKDTENLTPAARMLFNGVKRTKDGLQVLTLDRMKAFELACRLAGFLKGDGATTNIQTNIHAVQNILDMGTTDPQKAAKTYLEMITGQAQA